MNFPDEIFKNIMSYLPTPLDHHKKQMKMVNEDFEIIKKYNTSYDTGKIYWWLDTKGLYRRLYGKVLTRAWNIQIYSHRGNRNGTYEYIS